MSASLIGRLGSSAFRLSATLDVARGLVLLFGIGTKALPSLDSKTRWNNLWGGLAVLQTVGPSGHTNSPHPSSREGHLHRSVELEFPPIAFDRARLSCCCGLPGPAEFGAVHPYAVQDHGQPTRHATIAFFIPRCLAIFIAQALSQDHFAERTSMLWAAS